MVFSKMKRIHVDERSDLFDSLPDDIVLIIFSKLGEITSAPSEFISVIVVCKRFNSLGIHPLVLSKLGPKSLTFPAKNWSDEAHRFLKLCIASGNIEAFYLLGMIRFYCLRNRGSGVSLMAKAALKSHAPALYSLALIQFNGTGVSKSEKDLRAGVALCARAAFLGHIDALRELGHCLQDGYGVPQNAAEGHRLLVEANRRQLVAVLNTLKSIPSPTSSFTWQALTQPTLDSDIGGLCGLQSDIRYNLGTEVHPANQFLVDWFGLKGGKQENELRLCSYMNCGRLESRRNEYRRCSSCGKVVYCSRGCQLHDWRMRHKVECAPTEVWAYQDPENIAHIHQIHELVYDQTVEEEDDVVVET